MDSISTSYVFGGSHAPKDSGPNSGYYLVMDSMFTENQLDICTALTKLPILLGEVQQGHKPQRSFQRRAFF